MREEDYIDATNMAKAFIALQTVREILPDGELIEHESHRAVTGALSDWWQKLSEKVARGSDL